MSGCDRPAHLTPQGWHPRHTHTNGRCSAGPLVPRTNEYGQRLTVTYHTDNDPVFCETCGLIEPTHITSTCPWLGLRGVA